MYLIICVLYLVRTSASRPRPSESESGVVQMRVIQFYMYYLYYVFRTYLSINSTYVYYITSYACM